MTQGLISQGEDFGLHPKNNGSLSMTDDHKQEAWSGVPVVKLSGVEHSLGVRGVPGRDTGRSAERLGAIKPHWLEPRYRPG